MKVKTITVEVTVTVEAHEHVSAITSRLESTVEDMGESCDMIYGEVNVTSERDHVLEVD